MMLYNKNLEQYSTGNMRLTIHEVLKFSKLDLLFARFRAVLVSSGEIGSCIFVEYCYLLNIVRATQISSSH